MIGHGRRQNLVTFLQAEVKPRLTLSDVYDNPGYPELRVQFFRRGPVYWRGRCPLHPNADGRDTFSVNVRTLAWHCFSTCGSGDVVSYVNGGHPARGSAFIEAVRVLADMAGISFTELVGPSSSPTRPLTRVPTVHDSEPVVEEVPSELEAALQFAYDTYRRLYRGSPGEDYLRCRGLGRRVPEAGYCPGSHTLRALGMPFQLGRQLRLLRSDGSDALARRVILPFHWHGRLTCLHGRSIDPDAERKHLYTRCHIPHAGSERTWLRGVFHEPGLHEAEVAIFEGALDALGARRFGLSNAVGLGGYNNNAALNRLSAAQCVFVGFDADSKGQLAYARFLLEVMQVPRWEAAQRVGGLLGLGEATPPERLDARQLNLLTAKLAAGLERDVQRLYPPSLDGHQPKDWAEAAQLHWESLQRVHDLRAP